MSAARPIAPLPHHPPGHGPAAPGPGGPYAASSSSRHTPYHAHPREFAPGPKNRLMLALRSGIPSEVDWALPRLVVASHEAPDHLKLEGWIDSVRALCHWPSKWIDQLEKEVALSGSGSSGTESMLGSDGAIATQPRPCMPEWTRDAAVQERAINSLLVLRNASFWPNNAKLICQPVFLEQLERFFDLPFAFLLDLALRLPEPITHLLVTLQSIFPLLSPRPSILRLCSTTLPRLLVETRDAALITLILPILITSLSLPLMPAPPQDLAPHLLLLTTLQPPPPILDLALDLLITLTLLPHLARQVLALPTLPSHLRTLSLLLDHAARPHQITWDAPSWSIGAPRRNPASGALAAEQASRRRAIERDMAAKKMELTGGEGVVNPVGETPPVLPPTLRNQLYTMKEPRRSISWMHETFVYSSTSQLLQVTFWHAYRDFFQNPATLDPLLSASEVIKNVTIAFPGASAKVWQDNGVQKFVIAGMGFRKASEDDDDRYSCLWTGCPAPHGLRNAAALLEHVQTVHLASAVPPVVPEGEAGSSQSQPSTTSPSPSCQWATCSAPGPCTTSHILTHLPLPPNPTRPAPADTILSDPRVPEAFLLNQKHITRRPPPPLPRSAKLHSRGTATPQDARRQPTGVAFLTAMLLRNLARCLRAEIAAALPADHGLTEEEKLAKKKHLQDERFGLPIPDGVLKEEEEEDAAAAAAALASGSSGGEDEGVMSNEERERAKAGFESIEERLLDAMASNVSGIGQYLPDAVCW